LLPAIVGRAVVSAVRVGGQLQQREGQRDPHAEAVDNEHVEGQFAEEGQGVEEVHEDDGVSPADWVGEKIEETPY